MIDNSPRTIAAFHVLHRRNVPRHPPCAPTTNNNKKATQNPTTHTTKLCAQRSKNKPDKIQKRKDYSRPLSSSHTTHPHHTQPPHTVTITCSRARNNNHVPSQTPNNAPTHPNTPCQPHTTHHQISIPDDYDAAHEQPRAQASHPPTKTNNQRTPATGRPFAPTKSKAP